MLEGCPRGDVGAMDVGAVDVGNLARALHLSSGGTATGTYACETKLSQSLRRTAVLMHSVRTSVVSGNWEDVKIYLDQYGSNALSDEDRNITVRQVFTALRRSINDAENSAELDVVLGVSEIRFIMREWENRNITELCINALTSCNVKGIVGLLDRSAMQMHVTLETLSTGDDLFLGGEEEGEEKEGHPLVPRTHTNRADILLRSVFLIHSLRTVLSNSYIVTDGGAPMHTGPSKNQKRKDEIHALKECLDSFVAFFPIPTHSGIHPLIHLTNLLDSRCHDELTLLYDHIQDGTAKMMLMHALGKGGPKGCVGGFNGAGCDVQLLETVLLDTEKVERKSNDVHKMRRCVEFMFQLRTMLKQSSNQDTTESTESTENNRSSGGWKEWSDIDRFLPSSPSLEGIVDSWNNRDPDIQSILLTSYELHVNEIEYIRDELKHRHFVRLATRALCCHRLSGEIGQIDTSDVRLDLLDEAIEWHDSEMNKLSSRSHANLVQASGSISGWTTDLSSSLCRIVRKLRTLRCCVMEGEWGESNASGGASNGASAPDGSGGTVGEQCAWWYPERNRHLKPNVVSTSIKVARKSINVQEEYVPVTLHRIRQALEGSISNEMDKGRVVSSFRRFLHVLISQNNHYSDYQDDEPEIQKDLVDVGPSTELSMYEVRLAIDEDDDRQNLHDMTTALHRGGPSIPWVVGSLDVHSIGKLFSFSLFIFIFFV